MRERFERYWCEKVFIVLAYLRKLVKEGTIDLSRILSTTFVSFILTVSRRRRSARDLTFTMKGLDGRKVRTNDVAHRNHPTSKR